MMQFLRKVWALPRRAWGQVRWQIAACYALPAVVSVMLVAVFGLLVLNMLIRRGVTNLVERQIDLQVRMAAASAEALASSLADDSRNPIDPRWGERLAATTAHGMPGSGAFVRCRPAAGEPVSFSSPPDLAVTFPGWLPDESFRGVVYESERLSIHAWVHRQGRDCTVDVLLHVPLEQELAAMISSASGLEVSVPGRPAAGSGRRRGQGPPLGRGPGGEGRASGRREPPPIYNLWLRGLPGFEGRGSGDYLPVVVAARNWETGEVEDKVAFRVLPDVVAIYRQMSQYGQETALWIYVLPLLAITFLAVELGAMWIAVWVARRISSAIDTLSDAAGEISQGNFAHRITIRRNDQLGRLSASFNEMAGSLERLVVEEKKKESLERELVIARRVQEGLFPVRMPELPGVQLSGSCHPARVVSGDLYDVIRLGETRVGLLCADVSGKGVSASLIVSSLQAILRTWVRYSEAEVDPEAPRPAELVRRINDELSNRLPDNRFITLFWGEYDAATGVLRYANAGHNAPLLWLPESDEPVQLSTGGIPVGMFAGAAYEEDEVRLPAGSLLTIFTDGIPDALDEQGQEFGDDRLVELCRLHRGKPANEFVAACLAELRAYVGRAEQFDDMTMLVLNAD